MRGARVRARIREVGKRPRLSVFRSNTGMYAQVIDDSKGVTIASVSSKELGKSKMTKTAAAEAIGTLIAKKATEKGVEEVVFDRGSYLYHGRVKALAEAARKGGLKF